MYCRNPNPFPAATDRSEIAAGVGVPGSESVKFTPDALDEVMFTVEEVPRGSDAFDAPEFRVSMSAAGSLQLGRLWTKAASVNGC